MRTGVVFIVALAIALLAATSGARADLIGYWSFDDQAIPAAATADVSGGGNAGTVNGATPVAGGHTGGGNDTALDFNGTSNSVTTGASLVNGLSAFTTSGWVVADSVGSRVGLWGQNDRFEFGPNSTNGSVSAWAPPTGIVNTSAGSLLVDGVTWQHVATVHDGSGVKIYVDGVLKGSTGSAYTAGSTGFGYNIGGSGIWDGGGNWFNGRLDDVAIWNEALPEKAVKALAAGNLTPANWAPYAQVVLDEAPLGYWRLGEAVVATAFDETGNNDGTYAGFVDSNLGQPGALSGDPDTSALFDASDNRVVLSNAVVSSIGTSDPFSIEMWFNKTQDGRGDLYNQKGGGHDLGIINDGDEKVWVYWNGTAVGKGDVVSRNAWHHMVLTRGSTNAMGLWIDGALYSTGSSSRPMDTIPVDIWIGSNRSGSSVSIPFGGLIDEVAIYDRALTPDEIRLHYSVGVPEPATLSLLGLGTLALVRRRRRK